jgi:hypothetical protein
MAGLCVLFILHLKFDGYPLLGVVAAQTELLE